MNSPTPSSAGDSEAPVEAGTPRSATSENTGGSSRSGLESDNESVYTLVEEIKEEEVSYKEEIVDYGGPRDSD